MAQLREGAGGSVGNDGVHGNEGSDFVASFPKGGPPLARSIFDKFSAVHFDKLLRPGKSLWSRQHGEGGEGVTVPRT